MGKIALVGQIPLCPDFPYLALHHGSGPVMQDDTSGSDLGPVPFLKKADAPRQRQQCKDIRPDIHLPFAIPDGNGAAAPCNDDQIVIPGKQDGQREGPLDPGKGRSDCLGRRLASRQFTTDEMHHNLGYLFPYKSCGQTDSAHHAARENSR